MSRDRVVNVIGGGLAGSEAAMHAANFGLKVRLFEMRPARCSPAHKSADLAELVCSNSLKSDSLDSASGIIKAEMRCLDSIVMEAADHTSVPAGRALAVNRNEFASYLTRKVGQNPLVEIVRVEVTEISTLTEGPLIIATGPLTSESLSAEIRELTGSPHLYFYDSISPIVDAATIDLNKVFKASRRGKGETEEGDYLNCPLNKTEYHRFIDELLRAEKVETRDFEKALYFEGCLPIEVMAERGKDTLRYGPMKLSDPHTGKSPYAVVQLRMENKDATMYNLVGFQTKLKYPEQKRILRMIPGLEKAEFMRYGSAHRNTYINSPKLLHPTLQLRGKELIFFAGQIVGVEGYVESAAMGIVAGINAARISMQADPIVPPPETAIGALIRYITDDNIKAFQPMNMNFGLFAPLKDNIPKDQKRNFIAQRAVAAINDFRARLSLKKCRIYW